jgi:3-dehydroquinate synthase
MDETWVEIGERRYPVSIGEHLLVRVGESLKKHRGLGKVMVVTNPTIGGLYFEPMRRGLEEEGFAVSMVEVPDGEMYKTLEWANRLYGCFLDNTIDRSSTVLALGGGVIGDLAGFVAATYKRGVPLVQVPTTLLAQVDASIGGKVAVDHPRGKNVIGCFHQPRCVVVSLDTLKTLDERELKAGLAEVIKYGAIKDESLFCFLEEKVKALLSWDMDALMVAVKRSCRIKASVVAGDELDLGTRMILNFGHTIGHALEAATGYGRFRHGEAVAIGMVCASEIGRRMGITPEETAQRIRVLIEKVGLPTVAEGIDHEEILSLLRHDKKVHQGKVRFVLTTRIGEVMITDGVPEDVIRTVIKEYVR